MAVHLAARHGQSAMLYVSLRARFIMVPLEEPHHLPCPSPDFVFKLIAPKHCRWKCSRIASLTATYPPPPMQGSPLCLFTTARSWLAYATTAQKVITVPRQQRDHTIVFHEKRCPHGRHYVHPTLPAASWTGTTHPGRSPRPPSVSSSRQGQGTHPAPPAQTRRRCTPDAAGYSRCVLVQWVHGLASRHA